jgi:hypothetical protein
MYAALVHRLVPAKACHEASSEPSFVEQLSVVAHCTETRSFCTSCFHTRYLRFIVSSHGACKQHSMHHCYMDACRVPHCKFPLSNHSGVGNSNTLQLECNALHTGQHLSGRTPARPCALGRRGWNPGLNRHAGSSWEALMSRAASSAARCSAKPCSNF